MDHSWHLRTRLHLPLELKIRTLMMVIEMSFFLELRLVDRISMEIVHVAGCWRQQEGEDAEEKE